jgi:hypothetical protein
MKRSFGFCLALLLGACTVPNFSVVADDAGLVTVDACAAQVASGKPCGASCPVCADGQSCDVAADCASNDCEAKVCIPAASCTDGKLNGSETDTDCGGGTCNPCGLTARCTRATDCSSAFCDTGVCTTRAPDPTCTDQQKNGTESDLDCGGSCDPCAVDKRCSTNADCVTLVCTTVCQPAACNDAVRNGDESDKDCGGTCASCDDGAVCKTNSDCKSLSCSGGHCVPNTCTDGLKNGTETGTDCSNVCAPCGTGQGCAKTTDCQSLVCTTNQCVTATCSDGVKNNTESEIDCGKGCKGCQQGQFCNTGADCASAKCTQSYCVPTAPTGGVIDPTNWIATASDTASSYPTKNGIDGKLTTRWSSGAVQYAGMWYQVDMAKPQIFFSLTVDVTNYSGDAPWLFDVYLSLTPTFPATPTVKGVAGGPVSKVTFPGDEAVVARYVKIVLAQNKPQSAWTIQELSAGN